MDTHAFLNFFRQAAPYIHAHHGKTFVIQFDVDSTDRSLHTLLHDCALLQSLGTRLILVHGMRLQIEENLNQCGIKSQFFQDKRITTKDMMPAVLNAAGSLRLQIEAALSMGMINSPMQDASVKVSSGNFIIAQPLGVIEGCNYGFTGTVRRINTTAIHTHLQQGEIVLVSPIGYAPTGETYNLNSEEVASSIASAIKADKLISIGSGVQNYIHEENVRQLTPEKARQNHCNDIWLKQRLKAAANACDNGIRRVHLIEQGHEGALLQELFTRDGVGIMVTTDRYDNLRPATADDINNIIALIRPLEEQGILVPRPREVLERDISNFYLLIRDSCIIACAALYRYPEEKIAELACLAVDPDYRQHQRADYLLNELEKLARQEALNSLFILTTKSAQWFKERGFTHLDIEALPAKKRANYNFKRNSLAYKKIL